MNLSDLKDAPFNPRIQTEESRAGLKASLHEFGDISGIVWNERNGFLVSGHQRLAALKDEYGDLLHLETNTDTPFLYIEGDEPGKPEAFFDLRIVDWDEAKHKAALVAANAETIQGSWTPDLKPLLAEIKAFELPHLEPLRFAELNPIFSDESDKPGIEEDEAPEPPSDPISRLGDIWILGDHRVLCGDSIPAENISNLMDGLAPGWLCADPPYGINVVPKSGKIGGDVLAKNKSYPPIHGDEKPYDPSQLLSFKCPKLIWGANYFCSRMPQGQWIVWDKGRPEGTTFSDCELAWTDGAGTAVNAFRVVWHGMIREGESGERHHPTQKPVKLLGKLIEAYAGDGIILDPFLGSGTTLIAAEQLGRRCFGIEIEPKYIDVICQRWANLTSRDPIRESDGAKFSELTTEIASADTEHGNG